MASDSQLESLKQSREDARQFMNEKKREFDSAKAHRDDVQRNLGPMVEQLKRDMDSYYNQWRKCLDEASSAYNSGEKSRARELSNEAKEYKSQLDYAKQQRGGYIADLKAAREALDQTRTAYLTAKESFEEWRDAVIARRNELDREREQQSGWQSGGAVDGEPARTKHHGNRTEALWGGSNPRGDGARDSVTGKRDYGHIVTNDGVNASYVRYPGEGPIVDNPDDK